MTTDNKDLPPHIPGCTTVQLSNKNLEDLIKLLNIADDVFRRVVKSAEEQQDATAIITYSARAKLAAEFAAILSDHITVGEPVSRDRH